MSTLNTTNLKNPSSGSNNIVLAADGSTTIATLNSTTITGTSVRGGITSGTAVASTSGTSIDFTSIPSYVKRVTVIFNGVSTNGSSNILIQIGDSGGVETTGYACGSFNAGANANSTNGFDLTCQNTATATWSGNIILTLLSTNAWSESGVISSVASGYIGASGGAKTLSDTLDRVRITTVNGTDTFDAGSINILYEG